MDSLDSILCQEVVCKLPGCLPNSDVSVGQHSGSCRQIHKKAPRSPWRAIFDLTARAGVLALLDASRGRRATLERAAWAQPSNRWGVRLFSANDEYHLLPAVAFPRMWVWHSNFALAGRRAGRRHPQDQSTSPPARYSTTTSLI